MIKKIKSRLKFPDAILFDLDNTLYPYNDAHNFAQKAICEKAIKFFSISKKKFDESYEIAKKEIKNRLGDVSSSHSRLLYIQRTLEIIDLGSQPLISLDFEQTYWQNFLSKMELFDGVKDLLEEIRLSKIPTAIVTDLTAQIQFRKIIYLGLDNYFDYVVTSEEVGKEKPSYQNFNLALQKINPKGENIWMIGDDPKKDILGAINSINAITFQKIHKGVETGKGKCKPFMLFKEYNDIKKLLISLSSNEY